MRPFDEKNLPKTDEEKAYCKALVGDQHRFGLKMPVLTNEDWGGSYHRYLPDRYMPNDEHGEVAGEFLSVEIYPPGVSRKTWKIAIWGTDDFYVTKCFSSPEALEAGLRRIPIIVDKTTMSMLVNIYQYIGEATFFVDHINYKQISKIAEFFGTDRVSVEVGDNRNGFYPNYTCYIQITGITKNFPTPEEQEDF